MSYSPPPYGYNPPSASAQDVPSLQWRQDNDNLNLLGILHYVYGGIVLLSAIGIIGYFTLMGSVFATIAHSAPAHSPSDAAAAHAVGQIFGGAFLVFGVVLTVITLIIGGLKIWAGHGLQTRHSYTLAYVVACLECLQMPLGTALGVFTLIVLSRPSVKALFDGRSAPPPMSGGYSNSQY